VGAGILDRQAADVGSVAVDPESEWWRGVAVLLTWQVDWGLLHPTIELPLVDEGAGQRLQRLLPLPARGEETARAVDAEAEAQRAHPRVRMVWEALQKFQTHVAERFVLDGVAVSLEICPETYMESRAVRIHARMFIFRAKRFRIRHAADVMFFFSAAQGAGAAGILLSKVGEWCCSNLLVALPESWFCFFGRHSCSPFLLPSAARVELEPLVCGQDAA